MASASPAMHGHPLFSFWSLPSPVRATTSSQSLTIYVSTSHHSTTLLNKTQSNTATESNSQSNGKNASCRVLCVAGLGSNRLCKWQRKFATEERDNAKNALSLLHAYLLSQLEDEGWHSATTRSAPAPS
jgi:hypothetical protein